MHLHHTRDLDRYYGKEASYFVVILFAIQISFRLDVFLLFLEGKYILRAQSWIEPGIENSNREKYRYEMYRNIHRNTGFLYRNISQNAFCCIVASLLAMYLVGLYSINTSDMRQSKMFILSTNIDLRSLETEFLIAVCSPTVNYSL